MSGDLVGASFVAGNAAKAAASQALLLATCRPGTPVRLVLSGKHQGDPVYTIMAQGKEVGQTSIKFGKAMWQTLEDLNGPPKSFPRTIKDLWVRDIITVVGDLADERIDRSLRTSGLWLGLELEGLGYCDWFK